MDANFFDALRDEMSAADLKAAIRQLQISVGPKAEVSLYLSIHGKPVFLTIKPFGYGRTDRDYHIQADSFREAFLLAREWAQNNRTIYHNDLIRRMALSIIAITDEHGRCTERLLTGQGFAVDEVADHREAACARASEMAGSAPFLVEQ